MNKLITIFSTALIFAACGNPAQKTESTSNAKFTVDLLFEKDGCKVYRFMDDGLSAHYFTNCEGSVSSTHPIQSGKTRTYRSDEIQTHVKRGDE